MKRALSGLLAGLVLAGAYVFSSPAASQNVGDIFVPEDPDAFDPGLPVGARFPQIRALYEGREISDIDQFMADKGVVFFANRSVDW